MSSDGILVCCETLLCALRFDSIYKCEVKWCVLVRGGRRFLCGAAWGDGERGGGVYSEWYGSLWVGSPGVCGLMLEVQRDWFGCS